MGFEPQNLQQDNIFQVNKDQNEVDKLSDKLGIYSLLDEEFDIDDFRVVQSPINSFDSEHQRKM